MHFRSGALVAGLIATAMAATGVHADPVVVIDWTKDRLSVWSEDALLTDAVREVARKTGLDVQGAESLAGSITIRFSNLALAEGLRRLLGGVDHVIIEELSPGGEPVPVLVRVVGRLPSAAPVTDGGDPVGAEETVATEEAPGERLDQFLRDPEPATRRWAVERLGEVGDQWALPRILVALRDDDAGVRTTALGALGHYGPAAVGPLTDLLDSETDVEVRAAALATMGRAGGAAVAPLVRSMLGDGDRRIRLAAIEALGQAAGPVANEGLRAAVADQDPRVRAAALKNLGFFADEAERSIEEALVGNDDDLREAAAHLLETVKIDRRSAAEDARLRCYEWMVESECQRAPTLQRDPKPRSDVPPH